MCEECNFDIYCLQASSGVFLYTKSKRTKMRTKSQLLCLIFLKTNNLM